MISIRDQVIMMTENAKPTPINLVQVYLPTCDAEDDIVMHIEH